MIEFKTKRVQLLRVVHQGEQMPNSEEKKNQPSYYWIYGIMVKFVSETYDLIRLFMIDKKKLHIAAGVICDKAK